VQDYLSRIGEATTERDCHKIANQLFQLIDFLNFQSKEMKKLLDTAYRYGNFWENESEVFMQIMNLIKRSVVACIEPLDFLAGELRLYVFDKKLDRR
jgi:hypothetical protein